MMFLSRSHHALPPEQELGQAVAGGGGQQGRSAEKEKGRKRPSGEALERKKL